MGRDQGRSATAERLVHVAFPRGQKRRGQANRIGSRMPPRVVTGALPVDANDAVEDSMTLDGGVPVMSCFHFAIRTALAFSTMRFASVLAFADLFPASNGWRSISGALLRI